MSLIAKDLRVSIKTVSHNKRSALIKLGIRTLQPLIINAGYKKEIRRIRTLSKRRK
ncbi:hypothetical protein ACQ86O_27750 (plasmid) [Serratia sp. L9]|uniref:hypothetical protein n=1 Tax=Serratia sp. L9 TaxID=3423946 RepID=UPI003D667B41